MRKLSQVALALAVLASMPACSGRGATIDDEPIAEATSAPAEPRPGAGSASGGGDGGATGVADAASDAGAADAPPAGPWPGSQVFFFDFPPQKPAQGASWGPVLTDIIRHLHPTYGTQYDFPDDRITWGHEVSHGIASHLRFAYNVTGKPANGFYVLADRATLVVEPGVKLSHVGPRVPASLRGSRYQTYLVQQVASWDDVPSYVLDEWVAYVNGAEVGVDLVKAGLWGTTWRDGVAGALEFTMYTLALGLAVEELDPTYFAQYAQFREFVAWNTERAMRVYGEGSKMTVFASNAQDAMLEAWKTSPDVKPLRNFARRAFGGPYVTKVLGIAPATE